MRRGQCDLGEYLRKQVNYTKHGHFLEKTKYIFEIAAQAQALLWDNTIFNNIQKDA